MLKGQNFLVRIAGEIPAAATNCSLDTEVKTKQVSDFKFMEGSYDQHTPESYGWNLSTDHMVMSVEDLKKIVTMQQDHLSAEAEKETIPVDLIEAVLDPETKKPKAKEGGLQYSGAGIITKLSQQFENKTEVKVSISILGSGKLTVR